MLTLWILTLYIVDVYFADVHIVAIIPRSLAMTWTWARWYRRYGMVEKLASGRKIHLRRSLSSDEIAVKYIRSYGLCGHQPSTEIY